jgi:hypothetical protein
MGGALPSGGAVSVADAHGDADEVGADVAPAAKSKWPSRIGLSAGALVAIGAVVTTVIMVGGPRPDATLRQTGEGASLDALALINAEYSFVRIDGSTLRAHESFAGWDVLTGSNAFGAPCLVAIAPTDDWVRIECTPAPAQQVADTHPYTQPDGPMIRFILAGDAVEAWVYPHAKAP